MISDLAFGTTSLCYTCIEDSYLAEEIKARGVKEQCKNCGRNKESIQLVALAKRIYQFIQTYFEPVFYEEAYIRIPFGLLEQSVAIKLGKLLADFVVDNKMIIDDLLALVARHAAKMEEEHSVEWLYTYASSFIFKRDPDESRLYRRWHYFENALHSRTEGDRSEVDDVLMELFGDLNVYTTVDGDSVVRQRTPEDTTFELWRGRVAQSKEEAALFIDYPSEQIGPPPQIIKGDEVKPPAGRMNRKGVSVFYGASNLDTCVAELRPPVGSYVVAGQFRLKRTVNLLDLDSLSDIVEGSLFRDDFFETSSLARFFRDLVNRMSRPIMPLEEEREYVPTQTVAEFLQYRSVPCVQGVTYRSSQMGRRESSPNDGDNYNIVLFNPASGVEPYNPAFQRGSRMRVPRRGWFEFGEHAGDGVEEPKLFRGTDKRGDSFYLSIVPESLALVDVLGVQYHYDKHTLYSKVYDPTGQEKWTPPGVT